jgi:hypothetical protein
MSSTEPMEHFHRTFAEGDAFQVAGGAFLRVDRLVTVNGIELVIYQTVHQAVRDRRFNNTTNQESAAIPKADFAKMLAAQRAVSVADPYG